MVDKIKTLVVDDSAVARLTLTEILKNDPRIDFLGAAVDPIFALRYMEQNWPDVIILDIQMPRMDGLTFLKKIMLQRPTAVIICSTLTHQNTDITLEALNAGAVGVITKPKSGVKTFLQESSTLLMDTIKSAASVDVTKLKPCLKLSAQTNATVHAATPSSGAASKGCSTPSERIVAIGTSIGGTQALEVVLTQLPASTPGLVVVQHMPHGFTRAFAKRLDHLSQIQVKEAQQFDWITPGLALIAPGDRHLLVKRQGERFQVELKDGPLVSRHRPSVDVLFRSVAQAAGAQAIGIIMTGMGDDGALGLQEMHKAGAMTIAQDEASCVVYGMPKEAIKRGAVDKIVPLEQIPTAILEAAQYFSKVS